MYSTKQHYIIIMLWRSCAYQSKFQFEMIDFDLRIERALWSNESVQLSYLTCTQALSNIHYIFNIYA